MLACRAWTRRRASASSEASSPISGPSTPATRSRTHDASAGLLPPVETATATGPWRVTAGSTKLQRPGSSATLTHTPAASASSWTAPSTAGSPVAVTTSRYRAASPGS